MSRRPYSGHDGSASPSGSTSNGIPSHSYLEDEVPDVFDPFSIDPAYRLRTTRTAHSVIAESLRSEALKEGRKQQRRRLFRGLTRKGRDSLRKSHNSKHSSTGDARAATEPPSEFGTPTPLETEPLPSDNDESASPSPGDPAKAKKRKPILSRRAIYVNLPLPPQMLHTSGEPLTRYVRNKVRTSKYTLITFIPKNLFEQFRRVANIYFLLLVVLQVFSIFGATTPQIAMLPLVFILGMTAIKDGIEDWRRERLDNEVNNSAATKLTGWKNVNQPKDGRNFLERLFNLGPAPGKTSKGVRKLRESEAKAGKQIVFDRRKAQEEMEDLEIPNSDSNLRKESFPLDTILSEGANSEVGRFQARARGYSMTSTVPSMVSRKSAGVLDWSTMPSGSAQWERTLWKKLEVGDLVLLRDNEQVPADIIVLSTSDAENLCFVETKNLDGETNLKVRRGLKATAGINSEEDLEHARFVVDSEPPHANLYTYNGVLNYSTQGDAKSGKEDKIEPITINELLLRGCTLRNTKWVIGLVTFTGADTKIMLNGGDTPSKRSKIEKETNFNVIMNFIILILLCVTTAILHGYYRSMENTSAQSYEAHSEAADNIYLDSVIIFASCLIVFQNIVPISLYITIEIVKTIQAFFIFQDREMYYEPYDTACVPKTWNISDDLGQIEYVFSDKTGTLTQNIMEFKKCSIQGVTFGEGLTEAMMGAAKRDGRDIGMTMDEQAVGLAVSKDAMVRTMNKSFKNRYLQENKLTLIAPDLANRMVDRSDPLRPHIINFFRALAICHSVLSDKPEPEEQPHLVDYKAESPDEAALVAAARDVGFTFVNKTTNRIDIEVLGAAERWIPLRVLEFNSTRKRMSVIVRDPENRILLICKGADSVIYERLAKDHDEELKTSTMKDLENFANGGLRTLCISYRYLTEQEFFEWARAYDAASAAVQDRDEEIDKACEFVEHSLTLLGATALEDKLQEGVPDAIEMLHRAGIKLWILTGDKLQTAIEIGYSCNLLTNDMEVMIISAESEEGARAQIEAGLNKMASVLGPPPTKGGRKIQTGKPVTEFAVVIDGESLRYALEPSLKGLFLSLGTQCAAVVCCRVSPSQKALTVRLVKEGCNAMTLSIGDGANDVAMIQEANVGIGLYGLEGSQAAMSADYAFGQFRFLTRLLLVHGRWSYVRIADMHANFFYKNIIWVMAMFWFLIFNSFDATYLFEYTFVLLYNLIFTSLPVGIMGAFDQDANAKVSMVFPQLYKRGIQGLDYTRTRFWLYMFDGLYQSTIIFFVPFLVYGGGNSWSSTGRDTNGLYDLGTTVAAAGVFAANLYVGINTRYWTFITMIVISVSILLVFLWIPIYSAISSSGYSGEASVIYTSFNFWATVALTVFLAVGPRFIISSARQSYWPRDKDIVREAWVGGDLKAQLGIRHRRDTVALEDNLEEQRTLAGHLQNKLMADDDRGIYEAAALQSPQRRSPVSEDETRRFAYPPSSPLEERAFHTVPPPARSLSKRKAPPTVPPPLIMRESDSSGISINDPPQPHSIHPSSTPISMYSYNSPSALDALATPTNANRLSVQQLPSHPPMPRLDTSSSSAPLITPPSHPTTPHDLFAPSFSQTQQEQDLNEAYRQHRSPPQIWGSPDPNALSQDFASGGGWEDEVDKRKSTGEPYAGYAV